MTPSAPDSSGLRCFSNSPIRLAPLPPPVSGLNDRFSGRADHQRAVALGAGGTRRSGVAGGEVPALEGLTGSEANEGGEEALLPQQDPCSALDGAGCQGNAQGLQWKAPVNSPEISQMDNQLTSDWQRNIF